MKDNENSIFKSIRMKLVSAMILSLALTFLVDLLLIGIITVVRGEQDRKYFSREMERIENTAPKGEGTEENALGVQAKNASSEGNAEDTESFDEKKKRIEPNEFIEDADRMYEVTFRMRRGGLLTRNIFIDILLLLTVSVVIFISFYILFTNHIIEYFNEINKGIERIKNGDMQSNIVVKGSDELSTLASSINGMKYELKKNIDSQLLAEQMKNELVTNVAHDLRTPLTSTIGYMELLYRDNNLDEETKKKYIEVAYKKSKTLENLINELFDFTRFQKGKLKLHLSELDIALFLAQMTDEFYPQLEDAGLKLETDIPDEPIIIEGDGEKLARAFSNLMTNAIKYGADGKMMKLSVIELEDQVYVSITNYGKVIPQEKLPYIFDKFYRVDESRTERMKGTGLGLAIAKNVVVMHGGEISAKSDEKGTTFTVCLPMHVVEHTEDTRKIKQKALFNRKDNKGKK